MEWSSYVRGMRLRFLMIFFFFFNLTAKQLYCKTTGIEDQRVSDPILFRYEFFDQ